MSAPSTPAPSPRHDRYTPLVACCLANVLGLAAVAVVAASAAAVALHATGLDHAALLGLLGARRVEVVAATPLAALRLRLQVASLVGLAVAGVALLAVARRDPAVDLARGRGPFVAVPPALLVGGVVGARAAVPLATTLGLLPASPGVEFRWLGEFTLGLAAATAVGFALPPGLLAAARAGLVPRYTTTGQRGLAALSILAFASLYSPTDLPSFALVALPAFVGLAAGLALLEFRG